MVRTILKGPDYIFRAYEEMDHVTIRELGADVVVVLERNEACDIARAILKHFGEKL